MQKITSRLVQATKRAWVLLLVAVLNIASFRVLFWLESRFSALTQVPVFDTQNDLTPAVLLQQLPLYSGPALSAYLVFAAFDFVFPFVAALFLAVLWAWLLRINTFPLAQRLLSWNVPVLAFAATVFDYGENVSLLAALFTSPAPPDAVIATALLFKALKLAALSMTGVVTTALVLLAATNGLQRLLTRRSLKRL